MCCPAPLLFEEQATETTLSEEQETEMETLTNEEIWDDSELVHSWDQAVAEYERYHSIHARGENVEDVLREAEAAGLEDHAEGLGEVEDANAQTASDDLETQPDGTSALAATPVASHLAPKTTLAAAGGPAAANAQGPTSTADAMPMPEPVLSNVQDENLKQLMMAWYFAGYYTGLYEGQQQASQGEN